MSTRIFSYGSINVDHIYQMPHLVAPGETLASTEYRQVLGGKGANQSIAAAKAGVPVLHIGRYGKADSWVQDQLQDAGVDCSRVAAVDTPSGHAIIQVDAQAENAIILFAGANHSFRADELNGLLDGAAAGDWLLLQNECSCTAAMISTAAAKGMQVAFNPSPMDDSVRALPLHELSLLVVNEIEVQQLLDCDGLDQDRLVAALRERLPATRVVVTFGAKGALWVDADTEIFVPALRVEAVDTTAAGDTFLGYLLAALCQQASPKTALELGCKASSLAVQKVGASVSIPDRADVDQL